MSQYFLGPWYCLDHYLSAAEFKPGPGVTVQPGRATWNTEYFQEVTVRAALEELGYRMEPLKNYRTLFSISR